MDTKKVNLKNKLKCGGIFVLVTLVLNFIYVSSFHSVKAASIVFIVVFSEVAKYFQGIPVYTTMLWMTLLPWLIYMVILFVYGMVWEYVASRYNNKLVIYTLTAVISIALGILSYYLPIILGLIIGLLSSFCCYRFVLKK